ncbi:MAG: Hsp33 family molecular chaperone HslO [Ignavibacteria bacterium]|nr:Hsp33 family molecular chaperone HslO [Ignavibacteria bacterium]
MALTFEKHQEKDRVISVMSNDGHFRVSAIKNTNSALEAQLRHNLPEIPALLLARALSAASLLAVFLTGEERVIIDVVGEGLVSKVTAEAIQVGEVRGYCEYSKKVANLPKFDFANVLGSGIFRVMRILYNEPEPIIGIVKLVRGDITSDLNYYFAKSEQLFSIALLDADTDVNGKIVNSCGLIVQAMPGALEKEKDEIENVLMKIDRLTNLISPKVELFDVLKNILPWDITLLKNDRVDFFCRCSKEGFLEKLLTLDYLDVKEMKELGQNELVCQYCNSKYYLNDEDFNFLLTTIKARTN